MIQFLRSIFRSKPKRDKPLVRLWDKNWNLVETEDAYRYLTVDRNGTRWAGRVESIDSHALERAWLMGHF